MKEISTHLLLSGVLPLMNWSFEYKNGFDLGWKHFASLEAAFRLGIYNKLIYI